MRWFSMVGKGAPCPAWVSRPFKGLVHRVHQVAGGNLEAPASPFGAGVEL